MKMSKLTDIAILRTVSQFLQETVDTCEIPCIVCYDCYDFHFQNRNNVTLGYKRVKWQFLALLRFLAFFCSYREKIYFFGNGGI